MGNCLRERAGLCYPKRGSLLSGCAQGEKRIASCAAAVEARVGRGRVVMLAFRPQHRAQPHQTVKVRRR